MSRITYEDVEAICDELIEIGGRISTISVRDKLGKGSLSTIQKHISTWKEKNSDTTITETSVITSIPEGFLSEGQKLLEKIYQLADRQHAEITNKIKSEYAKKNAEIEALMAENNDYVEKVVIENEKLVSDIAKLDKSLLDAVERTKKLESDYDLLKKDKAALEDQLSNQKSVAVDLNKTIAEQNTELALLGQSEKAAKQEISKNNALHDKALNQLRSDQENAIDKQEKSHNSTIKALETAHAKATDDLKASNSKTITTLEQSISDLKKEISVIKAEQAKKIKELEAKFTSDTNKSQAKK